MTEPSNPDRATVGANLHLHREAHQGGLSVATSELFLVAPTRRSRNPYPRCQRLRSDAGRTDRQLWASSHGVTRTVIAGGTATMLPLWKSLAW
jgi:hypothetical protein